MSAVSDVVSAREVGSTVVSSSVVGSGSALDCWSESTEGDTKVVVLSDSTVSSVADSACVKVPFGCVGTTVSTLPVNVAVGTVDVGNSPVVVAGCSLADVAVTRVVAVVSVGPDVVALAGELLSEQAPHRHPSNGTKKRLPALGGMIQFADTSDTLRMSM